MGLAALLVAVVLSIGVAQSAAGQSVLRSAGLKADPERFTELALSEPDRLPDQVDQEAVVLTPGFTIGNQQGEERTYHWQIVRHVEGERRDTVLNEGRNRVPAGRTFAIRERVQLACPAGRVRLEVRLVEPERKIGAWIRCPGTPEEATRGG
jgi:hypothetical protein